MIIIIGILSAIGLGTFLNLVSKAKEKEPELKINGANKIQMNYYYENGKFSRNSVADVELPTETENYVYDVRDQIIFLTIPSELSIIIGQPKDNQHRIRYSILFEKWYKAIANIEYY